MTLLGEMLVADGEKKGLQRGRMEGRLEGHREGKLEGRLEGRQEGELLKLISLIRKKTQKGVQEEDIAELLEEDISVIHKICEILNRNTGSSDEAVCLEYMSQKS